MRSEKSSALRERRAKSEERSENTRRCARQGGRGEGGEGGRSSHFVFRRGGRRGAVRTKKINDLRVSDAISEIANKTGATSAQPG